MRQKDEGLSTEFKWIKIKERSPNLSLIFYSCLENVFYLPQHLQPQKL